MRAPTPRPTPSPMPSRAPSDIPEADEEPVAVAAAWVGTMVGGIEVVDEAEAWGLTRKPALFAVHSSQVLGASPFCNRKNEAGRASTPPRTVAFHRKEVTFCVQFASRNQLTPSTAESLIYVPARTSTANGPSLSFDASHSSRVVYSNGVVQLTLTSCPTRYAPANPANGEVKASDVRFASSTASAILCSERRVASNE